MEVRECPYCHKKVSLRKCSICFLRVTSNSIRCNHCNYSISLLKEPISVSACVAVGFLSMVIPMNFFLCYMHFSFGKALMYTFPIIVVEIILSMILTLRKIKFKRTYWATSVPDISSLSIRILNRRFEHSFLKREEVPSQKTLNAVVKYWSTNIKIC